MKRTIKILLATFGILTSYTSVAQEQFLPFEKNKEVKTVLVSEKMFQMMASVKAEPTNTDEINYLNLIQKLTSLSLFNTTKKTIQQDLKSATINYVSTENLKKYSTTREKNEEITIYIHQNDTPDNVSSLLLYDQNETNSIVLIVKGTFKLSELTILSKKMNLPIRTTF